METAQNERVCDKVVIMPYDNCMEHYIEELSEIKKKPVYDFFKRFFDIIFSAIALIVLAIPMLVVALLVKLTSKGPVFYHRERLGLSGEKIDVIKFRTMYEDAEARAVIW